MFKIGDKIVYPMQGAGIIEDIEENVFGGEKKQYFIIRILNNNMKLMLPIDNIEKSNVRSITSPSDLEETLSSINDSELSLDESTNSKQRYQANVEKVRSGSFEKELEVFSDLSAINKNKPLNTSEKQLLMNTKKFIIDEIALSKDITENEANDLLNNVISFE